MDFDGVFVDLLAEEDNFLSAFDGAAVVAVVDDLQVRVRFLVPNDIGHNWGQWEKAVLRLEKYLNQKHV